MTGRRIATPCFFILSEDECIFRKNKNYCAKCIKLCKYIHLKEYFKNNLQMFI